MGAFGVSGLAISAVSGDQTLVAQGFGQTLDAEPFTVGTRCGLFSATKVLASLTYARLEEEGSLSLNAPLGSYIEDAPQDWQNVPFFRLLNHTSGITMVVNQEEFATLAADPNATNASVYELVRDKPLDYQPGEYSRYRQSGYAIGEMVLQNRLNTDFATLVDDTIVKPAKMTATFHPASQANEQAPVLLSAGGYQTTAADMAKLFKAINAGTVIAPQTWKQTLLNEAYLFGDYSLGSVIEYSDDILTVGHSGGGARANVRYAPDNAVGAMVCTDDQTNNGLAMPLARMLIQEIISGTAPPLPMLVAVPNYAKLTAAQVIEAVKRAEQEGDRYNLSRIEPFMNEVGYTYLAQERFENAIKALTFNVERFPASANAHDSLGEALFEAGRYEAARERYRMVLELDSGNEHAAAMLTRIDQARAE
ncbi:MAG: serine hydrolase [Pseudomonadota bacterium]